MVNQSAHRSTDNLSNTRHSQNHTYAQSNSQRLPADLSKCVAPIDIICNDIPFQSPSFCALVRASFLPFAHSGSLSPPQMLLPLSLPLALYFVTVAKAQYRFVFGPTYGFHNTPTHILAASTTLFPSLPPAPQKPRLALWAGMDTTMGHLVQAVVVSSPEYRHVCAAGDGEWCVFASVLAEGEQRMGAYRRVGRGKGVGVQCKLLKRRDEKGC